MNTRMIFNISHPQECFEITAPELTMNFPKSCPQAQPQSGREEETRIVELATHVELSAPDKLVA
jgi:hypothetical protein